MLSRRLMALGLVFGVCLGVSLPAYSQPKKDDKKKDDKKKDKEPAKGEKIDLKWLLTKDKEFWQKMETTTTQTMKVMNNDVTQTQKQIFYFHWKVKDATKDKVEIIQKIAGVNMEIEIGGSKISYDSTKPEAANNPLGDFFKALVGTEFTVTLDPNKLEVIKMEGREDFLKKLVAANPQMKPLLETILSPKALQEMAEPTFAVIPTVPEPIGGTWDRKSTLNMGPIGTYTNTYKYTLKEFKDGIATISVDTKLDYTKPAESEGQGGLPFKIKSAELKSTSPRGTVTFDKTKGRVVSSTMDLNLNGTLSIEIGGQTTKVVLTQTQKSKVDTSDTRPTELDKKAPTP